MRYPPDLPITARRDDILDALRANQVVIVAGETGSGKSTQLPKMCLEAGRGDDRLIGHTQPRRLAARSIAERVAEELETDIGQTVGYTVRFTDRVGRDTRIKVMTDGILLADIQRDRRLSRYDTLIIDEAHERSLNIDFILGYLKQLLPARRDLKVIVTSATIDTARFSAHFDGAPVVAVSGRSHPVEVRYRPLDDRAGDAGRDQTQAICDAIEELGTGGTGDILVFLSGEREIRDTADAVRAMDLTHTEIVPLYARLSAAEQHRIFQPHPGRRVVLATNVAETSLTVPGIRYVIDPGTARISRYSRRTKVQRLPIEPISQASADQRAGRCGRTGPGICIRLYAEDDYAARTQFTEPEILRTNLASVILQMAAIDLGDIADFPFIEPPDARNVSDGIALLEELGALNPAAQGTARWLTPLGRRLAQLPLDPRLGRMVLAAEGNGCVREVMVIAAALSIQDPRERPVDSRAAADEHHRRFVDPRSDFLSLLRLWDYLRQRQKELSSNQFRKMCRAEFVNYLRVREWQDIYSQLRQVASGLGVHVNREPGQPDRIHMALLAGLLSHIGMRGSDSREYQGARGARFAISPGSTLFANPPSWVMAAELVETTRLWGQVVARIQPGWAEAVGGHLLKRSYGEPYWDDARGAAMTFERVSLYGLPIVAARRTTYGRVDREAARAMFIHHALIEGAWETHHAFFHDNQKLLDELAALETRMRRRQVFTSHEKLFRFYDERIGADVTTARHFDRWWNAQRNTEPELLTLTRDMFVADGTTEAQAELVSRDAYPDAWRQGDLDLALSYLFEPGDPADGVTVHIPLAVLNRVTGSGFDWQVPGLREELVTTLIRSLPKPVRRQFAPAPDYARAVLARCSPDDGPLLDVMATELGRLAGERIPPGSWQLDRLPAHLTMNFQVEDDGEVLGAGRDLGELERRLHRPLRTALSTAAASLEHTGARSWTFGTLPRVVETDRGGQALRGYPALVDEGTSVGVGLFPGEAEQRRAMWEGTRRLLLLGIRSPTSEVARALPNSAKLALASAPHGSAAAALDDGADCALDALLTAAGGPAWDADAFARLLDHIRPRLADATRKVTTALVGILAAARAIDGQLELLRSPGLHAAVADIREQLDRLIYPGFVTATGAARLADVLRYLDAIERRIDKLPTAPERDRQHMEAVRRLEADYQAVLTAPRQLPASEARVEQLQRIRWMTEELRVSLFAQSIGTAYSVSEAKVRRELASLA
jgi:ATP-dependent helicase HrpA